jgi:hypothetical protein
MPSSYLIFDFGEDEQNAQQARHKLESWKQGFRLGDKLAIKFEREAPEPGEDQKSETKGSSKEPTEEGKGGGKKKAPGKREKSKESTEDVESTGKVRLIIRLNFSDHEKLSLQRWLDRIPAEEPFKAVDAKVVRHNDPGFATTDQLFEELT